jgi:hypothetical protein
LLPRFKLFVALISVAGLASFAVSCGDDNQAAAPTPTVAAIKSPPPIGASATQEAVPSALRGDWHATLAPDDEVTLTLGDGSYRVQRGPAVGSGRFTVHGDQLDFFASSLCEGHGIYSWSTRGGELSFHLVGDDPCPRPDLLDNRIYKPGKAP